MKRIPRETWSYALLLIILFAIASIATHETIQYLQERMNPNQHRIVTVLMIALIMGFMLIAGAFGLWAMQLSASGEAKRRVGRLVDTMDYISDGLLVVDKRGHIQGANRMAMEIARFEIDSEAHLVDAFPCLSMEDATLLLRSGQPNEVERRLAKANLSRSLRFRSQPSEGLIVILISDITAANAEKEHSRQVARLQLVGQMARGVAHDFNNLLTAIAAHASLLPRLQQDSTAMRESIDTIAHSAERGVILAGHLLALSRANPVSRATPMIGDHLKSAAKVIRESLSESWSTEVSVGGLPAVGLSGLQLEQVVANLGLMAADAHDEPGTVRISADRPGDTPLFDVGDGFAGVVMIEASGPAHHLPRPTSANRSSSTHEYGVIESVIGLMLEESGGGLDCLTGPDGFTFYRLRLPHGNTTEAHGADSFELPFDLKTYVGNWSILLAIPKRLHARIGTPFEKTGARVTLVDNIASALADLENSKNLDVILIHDQLLGRESRGVLKALLRLRPASGIAVLGDDPGILPEDMASDILFLPETGTLDSMLSGVIEARGIALRRSKRSG